MKAELSEQIANTHINDKPRWSFNDTFMFRWRVYLNFMYRYYCKFIVCQY